MTSPTYDAIAMELSERTAKGDSVDDSDVLEVETLDVWYLVCLSCLAVRMD